jgi:hypothetical protein
MVKRRISLHMVIIVIICTFISITSIGSVDAAIKSKNTLKINQFTTSNRSIRIGEKITLNWSTIGAQRIEITGCDNTGEVLKLTGTKELFPRQTTAYTLNAYAFNGEKTSKSIVVNVDSSDDKKSNSIVRIISFIADSTLIKKFDSVRFQWETENAQSVKLISSLGTVYNAPLSGEIYVGPNTNRTYTLVASDSFGNEESKEIIIVVGSTKN